MVKKTNTVMKDMRIKAIDNGYVIEYTLYNVGKDNRYEYLKNHNIHCLNLDVLLDVMYKLFKKYPLDNDD